MEDTVISVLGGNIDVEQIPHGIRLVIRDYDLPWLGGHTGEKADPRLKKDDVGRSYIERVYTR